MSGRVRAGYVVLVGALVVGCATPKPTPTPAPVATEIPTAAPTPSPDATVVPSPAASVTPSQAASPAPSPAASSALTTLSVEARDLSFSPKALEVPAGQPFELTLHNGGRITHNVTIDSPGVQLVVPAGRTGSTVVEGLAPGTYPFYCSVSGHREAGMSGTLTVK